MAEVEFPVEHVPEGRVRRPDTVLEAVMQAPAYETPEESHEEASVRLAPLRRVLNEALAGLGEDERRLVDKIVFERRSFRQLEDEWKIPKTTLHRWYAAAIGQLRVTLADHPQIQQYLLGERENFDESVFPTSEREAA